LPFITGGEPIEWAPEISPWMSLAVIILSMTVATVASLIPSAREKSASAAVQEPKNL
jgi:tellurite resistance protein TerC